MAVCKSGLGFWIGQSIAEIYQQRLALRSTCDAKFFMLYVRAIPRPLLPFGPPHGGMQKWSLILDWSKHSRDIAATSRVTEHMQSQLFYA